MYFKNIKEDSWTHIKVKKFNLHAYFSFLKEIQSKILNLLWSESQWTYNGINNSKLFYSSCFYCQLQVEFRASLDFSNSCGFLFSSCVLLAIIGRKKTNQDAFPSPLMKANKGAFQLILRY